MEGKYAALSKAQLFTNVEEKDFPTLLHCLSARFSCYAKGETILSSWNGLKEIIVVLEGAVTIQHDDFWGNRTIVARVETGQTLGETAAMPHSVNLMHDLVAAEDCSLVFLNLDQLLTMCPSACPFHTRIIQNFCYSLGQKNQYLVGKLDCITRRSTREKILSYLSMEAAKKKSSYIEIPFNRQEMADFLSVERSALSKELGKLRDEGYLKFSKNRFELLKEIDE